MSATRQFRHGIRAVFYRGHEQGGRGSAIVIALLLFAFHLNSFGQSPSRAGKIQFDLKLNDSSDSTSPLQAWPAPGDITANPANPAAVTAIFETLGAFQNAAAVGTITDPASPQLGQSGEDFIENLKGVLTGRGFLFKDGFDLPVSPVTGKLRISVELISFTSAPAPASLPVAFEIWVRSALLPSGSPALRWSIREIAAMPGVQEFLQAQSGKTTADLASLSLPENFSVIVLPPDGPWIRPVAATNPNPAPFTPIFAAALAVARTAVKEQVLTKPRTPQNRNDLASPLHESFAAWPMSGEISFADELSPVDNRYTQQDQPAWVLRLTRFDPVQRESVTVDEIQLGDTGRQSWTSFLAHQQEAGKNMEQLVAQKATLEQELATWLRQEMPWGTPHFATNDDQTRRMDGLRQKRGVAAVNARVFRDETRYSITWQPVLTSLEASGTYNSDRGGNISGKLSVQTRDLAASAEGFMANRRRGLFADVSTTPARTHLPDEAMLTWGALGEYTRETPVRWGTPKTFSLRDEEYRTGLRGRIEGGHTVTTPVPTSSSPDSTLAAATTRARRWRVETIVGYRKARLIAENFTFAERPDAEAPFASVAFTGEWEHGPANGRPFSALHVDLGADASLAHDSNPNFARCQGKLVEEIRPFTDRWENSLVRLTASGGFASEDTPLAWWYRLGGDERMRGFELGELTGRSFTHVAIETGVALGAFLPAPVPRTTASTSATAAPGFDFRQIRILLGVEHAWVENPPTFTPAAPAVRDASSYSISADYAGAIPALPNHAQLSIGYGYAPRSSHRSGRVFVSLRVPISIPQPP